MKINAHILLLSLVLLSGCRSSKHVSTFSTNNIELGMSKQDFISRYGKPYNQEISYADSLVNEKLFYKEELYISGWYVITTAFHFENNRLVKQEIANEEKKYPICNCKDTGNK